jgi:transcriptional regulator with XRE-family HTH domain
VAKLEEFGLRVSQERRLKAARDCCDIGQKDVAKAVGTTPASVSRWEAGLNMPSDRQLEKLAAYFGVTAAWLRYGVETRSGVEPKAKVSEGGIPAKLTRDERKRA